MKDKLFHFAHELGLTILTAVTVGAMLIAIYNLAYIIMH